MGRKKRVISVGGALNNRMMDGRVKLLPCQVERLREIREETRMGYGDMSKKFYSGRVSKSTIYYICNPDKYDKMLLNSNAWQRGKDYDSGYQVAANKRTREKKRALKEKYNTVINEENSSNSNRQEL